MSGNRWVYGNLALSQSADSAGPVYARRPVSGRRSGDFEAMMLCRCLSSHLMFSTSVQAHPLRFQSRVSPIKLFSRTGSRIALPSRQYISLDLEDYQ